MSLQCTTCLMFIIWINEILMLSFPFLNESFCFCFVFAQISVFYNFSCSQIYFDCDWIINIKFSTSSAKSAFSFWIIAFFSVGFFKSLTSFLKVTISLISSFNICLLWNSQFFILPSIRGETHPCLSCFLVHFRYSFMA